MSSHPKIHDQHRQRLAYIYIRQSTLRQVAAVFWEKPLDSHKDWQWSS